VNPRFLVENWEDDAMCAYWIEQTESDVPAGNHWLSPQELSRLAELRFEKRRADWSLGRWTAKCAVASFLKLPVNVQSLVDIEVRAATSGAPEVFLFKQKADVSISLSHRSRRALCVVGLSEQGLGCDLEQVESRDISFVADFFTANEQKFVDRAPVDRRPALTTLLWSAKESALKSLHVGLRLDTTSLEVSFDCLGEHSFPRSSVRWSSLWVRTTGDRILPGWWHCNNNMVRTIVFNPSQ
jgi:4'-phosphopantetheinyl transferase